MNAPANRTHVMLNTQAKGRLASVRYNAIPVREQAEMALLQDREVVFDFIGIAVTQSFVDELIGALILKHGPAILERIIFKNCADDTRAIIEFVATDRCDQYLRSRTH